MNSNLTRILFYLLVSIVFSFYLGNSHGQNSDSNGLQKSNASLNNVTVTNLTDNPPANVNTSHKLKVVSSFFPIGEFVKKIGGNLIDSSLMVPVGIEPHDGVKFS